LEWLLSKEQQLWKASTDGDLEKVNLLAGDETVDVNWVGEDRLDTSLHRACRFRHLEIVKVMLAHPKIEVNKGNKGDASPFFIVCQERHMEVVSLLLADQRIDPNKPKKNGTTPFFMASHDGHKEVVSLLLADPRIDITCQAHSGETALEAAFRNGHINIGRDLLKLRKFESHHPSLESI